jgi:hypothetical protein
MPLKYEAGSSNHVLSSLLCSRTSASLPHALAPEIVLDETLCMPSLGNMMSGSFVENPYMIKICHSTFPVSEDRLCHSHRHR